MTIDHFDSNQGRKSLKRHFRRFLMFYILFKKRLTISMLGQLGRQISGRGDLLASINIVYFGKIDYELSHTSVKSNKLE